MPALARDATRGRGGRAQARPAVGHGSRLGAGLGSRAALATTFAVLALALLLMLTAGGGAWAVAQAVRGEVVRTAANLGVRLHSLRLQGVSGVAQADVVRALDLAPGRPLLGIDLADLRQRVEAVGWIESARITRFFPDTLVVSVVERPRLAVWQMNGQLRLVDAHGQIIPEAQVAHFSELPLVVGDGANEAAGAILPLVQARPGLAARVEAFVRVDSRRWDLRLKDGGIIQLPSKGEDAALIELDQLDQRSRLLELGFARIDLRNPELVTVRPRGAPPPPVAPRIRG